MTESQARVREPFPGFDVDDLGDFAVEHRSVTLADQLAGGPERAAEPESPKGLAGMDD
ncbi:hypothetical protein AB0H83_28225 [Dactylosporangium sp. NPDC050688]|uniref:hypothetical protein n=1 Tax=Dactylosporangium sp. NPDC050688 TaxID=3157217 RepID=UPI0033F33353